MRSAPLRSSGNETRTAASDALRWVYSRSGRVDSIRNLKDPLRLIRHLRRAIRGIADYGRLAEELWGVSPLRQLLVYLPLFKRFGHTIDEFYFYRLCTPEWRPHAEAFLPSRRMTALVRLYDKIGIDDELVHDKARFARHCAAEGLPVIPTILELDRGEKRWCDSRGRSLPAADIIVKPSLGLQGQGVRGFEKVPGGYRDENGNVLGAQALIELWSEESEGIPLIVQPRVRNAREVSAWSTGALCSVRLVTTRRPDEPPVPLLALFRMPNGDAVADNVKRGGIAATVDLASGELGPALAFKVLDVMRRSVHERHPRTGEQIIGRPLPCWDETIKLGLRAHECVGAFHSIGWDIAITDDGPILIEGNPDWGVRFSQYPGPMPLGWTRLPEDIRCCFEARSRPPGGLADAPQQKVRR